MTVKSSIWHNQRTCGPAPSLPEQAHPSLGLLSFHPDLVEHPEALEALAAALRPGPTFAWQGQRVLAALADDLHTILRIDSGRALIVEDPGTPAARVVGVMEQGTWVGLGVALRLHWHAKAGPQLSAQEISALLKSTRMALLQPQEDPSLLAESQIQAMKLLEQAERVVRRASRLRIEAAPGEPLRTSALPMSELQALLRAHPALLRWVESAAILSDLPEQERLFSKHPQLCRLDPADRLLLLQMSALRRAGERDCTLPYQRAGEAGAWVGTVVEGAARLTIPDRDGTEHSAGMAVPGEIFGLEAAFPPGGGLHIPERPPMRRTSVTLSANCTFVETAWPIARQVILNGLLRTQRDLIQVDAWAPPHP